MMYYTPDGLIEFIIAKSDRGGQYEPVGSASFLLDACQKLTKPAYRHGSKRLCFRRCPRHLRRR
jgi:hypothetical protein